MFKDHMCAWMGREKEHKEEISRRLERRDFLGPMTSLSLSLEMEDSIFMRGWPNKPLGRKTAKGLDFLFPYPCPPAPSQERTCLEVGRDAPPLEGLTCGSPTQGLPRESLMHVLCWACRLLGALLS